MMAGSIFGVKRVLGLLLALVLALSMSTSEMESVETYVVLESESGFNAIEQYHFALLNAEITLYEHIKTGALVMLIDNEDTNRVFDITFKTPVPNDTGIPHVFEHATLNGSEKYPSQDLFFNLAYQTYNTYMNAATYPMMTTYPVASLSEDQLLMYADFYVDSAFHPLLKQDKSIFDEEAWRYELTSADAEMALAGTVYSEMQGANTLNRASLFNAYKAAFPGADVTKDFGGDPDYIPDMKYEDLVAYHDAYYHPSNSFTVLYGKFERLDDFLTLLDDVFSDYEKREFDFTESDYAPIAQPVNTVYSFPVEQGMDTTNGSVIHYVLICEDASDEDVHALDQLTSLINSNASAVMQAFEDEMPYASVSSGIDFSTPEPCVIFSATGVNPGDEKVFTEIIEKALAQIAREGFSPELIDATASTVRMGTMLIAENSAVGVDIAPSIAYYWAAMGDTHGYFDFVDSLDYIEKYNADGTFKSLIERYLINNERCALALTTPEPGLEETKKAALKAKLAQVKASMSDEEIQAIIERTAKLGNPQKEDTSAMVAALTAVTVESLPEQIRIFEILDRVDDNGVRRVDALADTTGVSTDYVLFDASHLTYEQLQYLKLYMDLVGALDTENYTSAQLAELIERYMYNGVIRMGIYDEPDGSCIPRVRATWTSLNEDLGNSYALLAELMFATKLDDANMITGLVGRTKSTLKDSITQNIYNVIMYRAMGTCDASSAMFNALTYLEYYQFLTDIEAALSNDPNAVLENLKAVRDTLNNSYKMVAGGVGGADSIVANQLAFDNFVKDMPYTELAPAEHVVPTADAREGIILSSAVNYNLVFAPFEQLGLEDYTGDLDALTTLVTDTFLLPLLRDQYGVYSVIHGANEAGVCIISYRDPNIVKTFDVYESLDELLAGMSLDQATLDGYILSSYSYYAMSQGELTGAFNAVLNYLSGIDQQETIDAMRALKQLKAEDISKYKEMYAKLSENGVRITAGSAAAINENADLYTTILNPFGAVDATQVEFTDVPQEHPNYETIRYAFESGLIQPVSDTYFGADEAGTLGDLALAVYVVLGGAGTGDDAIAYLSPYGVLPSAPADTQLTNAEVVLYSCYFSMALGLDTSVGSLDSLDAYTDADTVTDADTLYALMWALGNEIYDVPADALNASATATRAQIADIVARLVQKFL